MNIFHNEIFESNAFVNSFIEICKMKDDKLSSLLYDLNENTASNSDLPSPNASLSGDSDVSVNSGSVEINTIRTKSVAFAGNGLQTFTFLDQSDKVKNMSKDCGLTHSFKLRGANYIHDKVKIAAGPPIAKFVTMEFFEVNVKKYGDRHDHISRIGKVKERIEILSQLEGNPFIFVMNIQVPGDPPVSAVFYFAIPNYGSQVENSDTKAPAHRILKSFFDIPESDSSFAIKATTPPRVWGK